MRYREALSASVYPIHIDLGGEASCFDGNLELAAFTGLTLIDTYANTPLQCGRDNVRGGDDGSLLMKYQLRGRTSYVHRDRFMDCEQGSLALFSDRDPIEGEQHCAARAIVARFSAEMVQTHAPGLRRHVGTVTAASSGAAKMLGGALASLWDVRDMTTPSERKLLPLSLLRLAEIAFCATSEAGGKDITLQLDRVRDAILENLASDALNVATLCRLLGMSRSGLFALTAAAGTTPERLIFDARLDVAERRLCSDRWANKTIGAIAFSVGFQELSHFTRRFRERFGVSPARYRSDRGDNRSFHGAWPTPRKPLPSPVVGRPQSPAPTSDAPNPGSSTGAAFALDAGSAGENSQPQGSKGSASTRR